MGRAIDSEVAFRFLTEQKVKETGAFSKGVNKGLNIARSAMRNPDAIPTLPQPSNEPLTLEEIREMEDEPAYLKVFDPLLNSGWHIITAVTQNKILFREWSPVYVPIDGLGKDYNFYRRPPEGEEGT